MVSPTPSAKLARCRRNGRLDVDGECAIFVGRQPFADAVRIAGLHRRSIFAGTPVPPFSRRPVVLVCRGVRTSSARGCRPTTCVRPGLARGGGKKEGPRVRAFHPDGFTGAS